MDDNSTGPLVRRDTITDNGINGVWVRPNPDGVVETTNAVDYGDNPLSLGGSQNYIFNADAALRLHVLDGHRHGVPLRLLKHDHPGRQESAVHPAGHAPQVRARGWRSGRHRRREPQRRRSDLHPRLRLGRQHRPDHRPGNLDLGTWLAGLRAERHNRRQRRLHLRARQQRVHLLQGPAHRPEDDDRRRQRRVGQRRRRSADSRQRHARRALGQHHD